MELTNILWCCITDRMAQVQQLFLPSCVLMFLEKLHNYNNIVHILTRYSSFHFLSNFTPLLMFLFMYCTLLKWSIDLVYINLSAIKLIQIQSKIKNHLTIQCSLILFWKSLDRSTGDCSRRNDWIKGEREAAFEGNADSFLLLVPRLLLLCLLVGVR